MKTIYGINNEDKIFIHDKNISLILRFCIGCAMPLLSVWYFLLLIIARLKIKTEKKQYYFSICAIFKDEGLILNEWIEYHLILGVEHFYLYNNNSSDNFKEILKPYINKGYVTLIDWPIGPPYTQGLAYSNFYKSFRSETNWVAFIDLDEFICPFREIHIKDWLKKFDNFSSVVVYWKQFGTSGKIYHDETKLVTEQYTVCWDKYFAIGKTFVNTSFDMYDFSAKYIHATPTSITIFGHKFLIPPINEFKKFVIFKSNRIGFFRNSSNFSIQINHYSVKSYANYCLNKMKKGVPHGFARDLETFFWSEQYNNSTDHKIFRFMTELKINMGKAEDVQNQLTSK